MNIYKIIQSGFAVIFILIQFPILPLPAQTNADANITFVNQNIWRGLYQAGVSIQPEINLSYRNWSFQLWGTSDFDTEQKEIDLSIGYNFRNFNIGFTDYWFGGMTDAYLKNHVLENNITYTFSAIPLTVQWYTVVAGIDNPFAVFQQIAYSPYWHGCGYEFSIGYSLWENEFLDSKGFAINEIRISIDKEIELTRNFRLICGSSLIYNPYADNLFLVCTIGIPLSF